MNCIIPITCAGLMYISVVAGYTGLFCPLLPLLFISNRLYRYVTDTIFSFWQLYPTALVEIVCRTKVEVYGDSITAGKNNVLFMNHRTRVECVFLWAAMFHCTKGSGKYNYPVRFLLKDILRHLPGPGWIMQLMCFLYLKREWNWDEKSLNKIISYFCDMSYKTSLFLFPEGAIYTPDGMKASNKYAEKNKLPKYDCVMHPKTTGFAYIINYLVSRDNLDAVYDVTSVYPDIIPQNEFMLLSGDVPKKTIFFIKKYSRSELPTTEQGLRSFLENCWAEKEKTIKKFYSERQFPEGKLLRRFDWQILYVALIFWTVVPFIILYYVYSSNWFRFLILLQTIFMLFLNYVCGYGFQEFEVNIFLLKKRIFGRGF